MSGVLGIIDTSGRTDVCALIDKMIVNMSHREWFVSDRWGDPAQGLAFGRIGIGIFNTTAQPLWNADRTVALFMAGEIYDHKGLNSDIQGLSDEQIALALYQHTGDDFARNLNGAFIIAIWDYSRNRVLIANDRFGLYSLFYSQHAGRLIFAPEMMGILCDPDFPRTIDQTALAQYVRFQHLLGDRTFFEDIHLLSPGSLLTFDVSNARCRVRPYWSFSDIDYRPDIRFEEAVEEAGRLLRRSVQRLTGDAYRPGIFLSGGLDSRTILGMTQRRPITTMTFGARGCRDMVYAQKIARAAGSDHHWFDLPDGNWVREHADWHLELTEGYHSWLHMHSISMLPQARRLIDVNLTGWDGGTILGHGESIEPLQSDAVDDHALLTRLYYMFNQRFTWPSISEEEEYLLYCKPLDKQLRGRAFESFREELTPYFLMRHDVRNEYFYLRQHAGRLTHNMVRIARSHIEVRFPFFDYDLFDFLYSLPASIRGHQKLHRAMMQREYPHLAMIPHDKDEFLPTTRRWVRKSHALSVRLKQRFNRHVRRIFPERSTLYANYEDYLRNELRPWAENILFDQRTATRGIFDAAFLHTLMDRHLSGREEWTVGKIAPLITYEMMLRRFVDKE